MKLNELLQETEEISAATARLSPEQFMRFISYEGQKEAHANGYQHSYYSFRVVDGKINVFGDIQLPRNTPIVNGHLPFKFGRIDGNFYYPANIEIASFKNSPDWVSKSFSARMTNIKSFVDCPRHIGMQKDNFYYFYIDSIPSLVGIADHIDELHCAFQFNSNSVKEGGLGLLAIQGLVHLEPGRWAKPGLVDAFTIINKYIDDRKDEMFECQAELIENGFEEFAKL